MAAQASCRRRRQQARATAEVQNLISYGDPDRGPLRARKNAKGQILNRECIAWAISRAVPSFAAEDHV